MRNFSTETELTYVTIKGYRPSFRQASHLAKLFCKGFGSRPQALSHITKYFAEAECDSEAMLPWFTPSELGVIFDFVEWYVDPVKPCFVYHNLNTGFSLVFLRRIIG